MEYTSLLVIALALAGIVLFFSDLPIVKVNIDAAKELYASFKKFICNQCANDYKVETSSPTDTTDAAVTNAVTTNSVVTI
jgi:hypothetical protein